MRPRPGTQAPRVLVAGAGGALLHALRTHGPHTELTVLTTRPFRGMPHRARCALVTPGAAWAASLPPADHVVIQLGALRRAREAVFWRPSRAELLPLATAVRAQGARTLELLLADGSALSAAERRQLHALAFDRVDVQGPAAAFAPPAGSWPERLAAWMMATLIATMRQVVAARHPRTRPPVPRR
jgi:hypothetical protein